MSTNPVDESIRKREVRVSFNDIDGTGDDNNVELEQFGLPRRHHRFSKKSTLCLVFAASVLFGCSITIFFLKLEEGTPNLIKVGPSPNTNTNPAPEQDTVPAKQEPDQPVVNSRPKEKNPTLPPPKEKPVKPQEEGTQPKKETATHLEHDLNPLKQERHQPVVDSESKEKELTVSHPKEKPVKPPEIDPRIRDIRRVEHKEGEVWTADSLPIIGEYNITSHSQRNPVFMAPSFYSGRITANHVKEHLEEESRLLGEYIDHLNQMDKPVFDMIPGSIGIVTSCHLDELCMASLIYMFDHFHVNTPVELWLSESDRVKGLVEEIEKRWAPRLRIKSIDAIQDKYFEEFGPLIRYSNDFDLKMYALVASEFEKFVWIDSDAFLTQNITNIVEQAHEGALFWYDRCRLDGKNPIWKLLNMSHPIEGLAQESGVIYIDKSTNWRGLYTAAYMNQRQKIFYSMLWGDKDTFYLGYEASHDKYAFVPFPPFLLGKMSSEFAVDFGYGKIRERKFVGYSFIQSDMNGRPFVVHLSHGGKEYVVPLVEKGKRSFSHIRTFDANRAHIDEISPVCDIKMDNPLEPFYGPLWVANDVLGPFEEFFSKSYKEAVTIIKKYPKKEPPTSGGNFSENSDKNCSESNDRNFSEIT